MEAPFRYPISDLADVERLLEALAKSPELVPGSLRLAEGQELLVEQLRFEGRLEALLPAITSGDFKEVIRALWQQPLLSQHPRYLRFNAILATDPGVEFSMRIDVPTTGHWPRWIDLEGSRDPGNLNRLRTTYASIGCDAQLILREI